MILGVVQLADHLCNSVGILQQFAPSGSFAGFEKTASKQPAVTNEGRSNRYGLVIRDRLPIDKDIQV